MLSQQTSKSPTNDNYRQPHRQQSTPTVYEAQQLQSYPAPHQFPGSHRRGMSSDQPVAQFRQIHPQDDRLVGITNSGQIQQHYLQEAQQHSQARPGQQQQQQLQHQHSRSLQLSAEEEFRNLQHQQLDAQIDTLLQRKSPHPQHSFNNHPQHSFNNDPQHVVKIERSRSHPETYQGMNIAPRPQQRSARGSPPQNLFDPQTTSAEQERRRIANAEIEVEHTLPLRQNLVSRPQRPYTPPSQSIDSHNPLTPDTSPYPAYAIVNAHEQEMKRRSSREDVEMATIRASRSPVKQRPQSSHTFVQLSPDPNATIKAHHREVHLDMFHRPGFHNEALPSPPNTSPLRPSEHFELMPPEHQLPMPFSPSGSEAYFDSAQSLHGSSQTSPQMSPRRRSPERRRNQFPGDSAVMVPLQAFSDASSPAHTVHSSIDFDLLDSSSRAELSPRAMSISDLNLDATIEETGISAEEVQSYISQPDPETGKWTCMYPECGKMFGRKENVRAHVQTHLGDRQFKCIHCGKCFVRQHDLKRHSKTHSGVKPYPCRCGNSFARHDALTRHRQRGICAGGFEGIVKKIAKRGRPRKDRPNRDDRRDKAERTRRRAVAKSYASSVSGTTESDSPESSPQYLLEGVDFEAGKDDTGEIPSSQSYTLDPEVLNFSLPGTPHSTEGSPSPTKSRSTVSAHTSRSTADGDQTAVLFEGMNVADSNANTAESNGGSQAGSPPGLSHSSPPSSTRFLDFDFGTNFNSSGSAPSDGTKLDSQTTEFASLSLHMDHNSPGDMFNSSWNESTFLNFDKDTTGASGGLFSNSFDDEIMFSDTYETNGGVF